MKILLVAMPDAVDFLDLQVKMPHLGIVSLAGCLANHEVKTLDLVLNKPKIKKPLEEALNGLKPQLVGLSAMSFQFDSLLRVARFVRRWDPSIRIVAGGYHVSLLGKEISEGDDTLPIDFLIRGEGEITFKELVDELEKTAPDLSNINGLSYREEGEWHHNPSRPLLDLAKLPPPNRSSRISKGYHALGFPLDVAETTRGCPHNCKFCSITQMYGHVFRKFPMERIVQDLQTIHKAGTKFVFFADDNIAYDVAHFRQVCQAICQNGLNDMTYITQISALSVAENPEMVADMDRANFRIVFVGFESMLPDALKNMKKPTNPKINLTAAALLRQHRIGIIAGSIVGYPEDTRESVKKQFQLVRQLKPDAMYSQYLTPYPKTVLRQELLDAGLVVNKDDYRTYNGFVCNIRTKHLSQQELEGIHKKEILKMNLSSSVIFNYFLKNHFGRYLSRALKIITNGIRDLLLPPSSRRSDL